jgi:hypothetical protein
MMISPDTAGWYKVGEQNELKAAINAPATPP